MRYTRGPYFIFMAKLGNIMCSGFALNRGVGGEHHLGDAVTEAAPRHDARDEGPCAR